MNVTGNTNEHIPVGDGTNILRMRSGKYGIQEARYDAKHYPSIKEHIWRVKQEKRGRRRKYAITNMPKKGGGRTTKELHRFIKELEGEAVERDGTHVRHLDDDGLNNISENIKVGTPGDNMLVRPRPRHRGGKPLKNPYMGVYLQSSGLYRAAKVWNGEHIYLGSYADAVEAAIVWDKKTVELLDGHIVRPKNQLNFPERLEEYLAEINK
jgi:hypothetical protein